MPNLLSQLQVAVGNTYRVVEELSGGGMSRVFLAEEVALERRVVIKVLPPEMSADVSQDRFQREIRLAAKLQHPHVVSLLTAGSSGDLLYYVMPYIEGSSLGVKLHREGELPVVDVVRILKEVIDALAYAHKQGLVHRDIKPDNVMISGRHALVTDFGVAKAVSESGSNTSLTSLGVALGTPAYMAPEQAGADPHTDHRADIYAVGVLAYQLLTGEPPFTGPTPQAVMSKHLVEAPHPVAERRPAVPEVLASLVMRCLEKRPADRWQSADEMLPVLESLGTPTSGLPPAQTSPFPASHAHPGKRWQKAAAAASLAGLVALAGWWVLRGGESAAVAAIDTLPRAWVILSDFEGLDEDPGTREMVQEVVRAGMDRSSTVEVVPDGELRGALERAGYESSTRITEEIARELAVRSEIATVISGLVNRTGDGLSLLVRVVEAEEGRQLASTQRTVRMDSFIDDVGGMTDELRSQLGDLPRGARSDRPLSSHTTPSFEAFNQYREGFRLYLRGESRQSREWFDRALEFDSLYAEAYRLKGFTYWYTDPDSVEAYLLRARAIEGRLSPNKQEHLSYFLAWNRNDLQTAVSSAERLIAQGERRHYDLATLYGLLGRHGIAADWWRRHDELRTFEPTPTAISRWYSQLFRAGRVQEARELVPLLDSIYPENSRLRVLEFAAIDRDWDSLITLGREIAQDAGAPNGVQRQGQYAAISGHLARGEIGVARAIVEDIRTEAQELGFWGWEYGTYWDEVFIRLFSGLEDTPPDPPQWNDEPLGLYGAAVWGWSMGDTVAIRRSLRALEAVPQPPNSRFGEVPAFLEAMIDWHAGDWDRIVDRLGPSAERGRDIGRLVLRANSDLRRAMVGEAHRQLGQPDSAAHYLALLIDQPRDPAGTRGRGFTDSFVHFDVGGLYAEAGQNERAVQHYNDFLEAFTRPDSGVAWMREQAQREVDRLSGEG